MPSPPKTTDALIVAAAKKLLESRGRNGFSMKDVADSVGVRAPSLYSRFADRAQILAQVEIAYWRELEAALARAAGGPAAFATLLAQARAYRAFAKAHPEGYALMFDAQAPRTEEGTRARASALAPTLAGFAELVGGARDGDGRALLAARVLTPFLHGFVSMELVGAFRLGGGLDEAFDHGVTTILTGLAREHRAEERSPRQRPRARPRGRTSVTGRRRRS
jgi:AcrR family transcriptional regulator